MLKPFFAGVVCPIIEREVGFGTAFFFPLGFFFLFCRNRLFFVSIFRAGVRWFPCRAWLCERVLGGSFTRLCWGDELGVWRWSIFLARSPAKPSRPLTLGFAFS